MLGGLYTRLNGGARTTTGFAQRAVLSMEFADNDEMIDHDDALIPALLSRHGEIEPFARLLVARIERTRTPEG